MSVNKAQRIFVALRLLLAGIIAAHGWARLGSDAVTPFGTWLESRQIPLGLPIAYAITFAEIIGTPLLALGRFVPYLCVFYCLVYTAGIALVHAPEGWFVVGLGRNGMEYSVLLIATLLGVAYWHHQPDSVRS